MPDIGFILYNLVPRAFFLAICMDVINTFFEPLNGKSIISVLVLKKGYEAEYDAIERGLIRLTWRYLPIVLFGVIGMYQGILHYGIQTARMLQLGVELWAFLSYWSLPGFNIDMLGGALNMLACVANHGLMPAPFDDVPDGIHCLMTKASHLKPICDWILVGYWALSPGDFLIVIGAFSYLVYQNFRFFRILFASRGSSAPQG